MRKGLRAVSTTCILLLAAFSVSTFLAPSVAAATRTWTTDTDFNDPTAAFTSTTVVGTGVGAKVELAKDYMDWKNLNPSAPPPVREAPAAAFSSLGNRTVLFGGYNSMYLSELDDTWEFDYATNAWTQYSPNPRPIGREFARMSYDPVQKVVVLFGGVNGTSPDVYLEDTWEYNVVSRSWSETNPIGPLMISSAMTYDSVAKVHIMVGRNYTSSAFQTWAYNASANTWTLRMTGGPVSRTGHFIAYDEQLKRTVLFGGFDSSVPPGTLLSDTWEFNSATNIWTQIGVTGPEARQSHSMTYRPATTSILLFGGGGGSGVLSDTWRYTSAHAWESVGVSTYPPARQQTAFTYDANSDVAILFGGRDAGSTQLGDTWSLEASYRAAGKYESAVLDGTIGNADWQTLWWNKSTQPANTFLRFQLATSDVPTGPWSFVGPNGSVSAYYTTTPSTIWTGHDNHRFLRFLGDFGSYDTHATPSMEDVTIQYDTPPLAPYIVSTSPAHLARDVPLLQPIDVMFVRPMNLATVKWQFLRGTNVTLSPNWSMGETFLSLTHSQPFAEGMVYQIQITGKDVVGNDLVPGPVPNPWVFVTVITYPYIAGTNPMQGDLNVPLDADIVVDFSEPMNTDSVKWTIAPNITHNGTWENGDARLVLSHTEEFHNCTLYEVQITQGEDKAGLYLIPGPAPNPWTFRSECINPFVMETHPFDIQFDVSLGSSISVTFSEPMDISTVTWTLLRGLKVLFTPHWSNGNQQLELTHSQEFAACDAYEIKMDGKDVDGNPMIPSPIPPGRPNPWFFMTTCGNPSILGTFPANGATDVRTDQNILIAFSMGMDRSSVEWTITPRIVQLPAIWNDPSVQLTIPHGGFEQCKRYTVHVTKGRSGLGMDLVPGMAPNPFYFDTICERPYVVSTDPANNALHVPLDKSIVVEFSEPMNASSLLFVLNPDVTGRSYVWSNNYQTLTVNHSADFAQGTLYLAYVDGRSADGSFLITNGPQAQDPWNFTTRFPGFYITSTNPANGAKNVSLDKSIVVEFSEPADRSSFSVSISPTIGMTRQWSNDNRTVTLTHVDPFTECIWYDVTADARDTGGNPLITVPGSAPDPWSFKVMCIPPQILSTDPPDGAMGVPLGKNIVVTFSEPMNIATVSWSLLPPDVGLTPAWSGGNTVLHLNHTTLLKKATTYTVMITGKDSDGVDLVTSSAPNPWSFTTLGTAPAPPGGLWIQRVLPSTIRLTWRSVPSADMYRVYESTDKFALFPWGILGTTTTTTFDANHLNDGLNHYYIVRAVSLGTEGPNSTMAVKIDKSIWYSPAGANVYWFSLSYRTTYTKASDISGELTSTLISVVAKWEPAIQRPSLWYFFRGKWRGTDFTINPGDGLYVGAQTTFTWVIVGTDGSVTLSFNLNPPTLGNVNWISLPYTSTYAKASDIVIHIEGSIGPGAHTKITELGRWDPATQTVIKYMWTASGWSGTDFMINPGDGIYLKIVASFTWTPRLITPEVP
jgi:N-acetylneuraminic acid mutarotase